MDRLYNRFRRFCAFLIGAVFFVSGLMKLLDPVGAGLVVSEYYRFFGTDFLLPSSKAVAVAMALLETLLGAALMTGLWRRVIAVISLIFLCGFTVLTIILVIFILPISSRWSRTLSCAPSLLWHSLLSQDSEDPREGNMCHSGLWQLRS